MDRSIHHPIHQVSPGDSLLRSVRSRRCGRIAGFLYHGKSRAPDLTKNFHTIPGPDTSLLFAQKNFQGILVRQPTDIPLVVECEGCTYEGKPLTDRATWYQIVTQRKLAGVEGAFVVAWVEGNTLFLARDAIGARTLFFAMVPDGLVFATSIRAILETGLVKRQLSAISVATYLSYAYLPGRETLVQGIEEVQAGQIVSYHEKKITRTSYWELPADTEQPIDIEVLQTTLRQRLEVAVRQRLKTGEPMGAFLSGGLDSSLIVAIAQHFHDRPIQTFSVSFGSEYANELPFSSLMADHCKTTHHIVELSPKVILHHLDDSIGLMSDPIGDPLTVPNALLFRTAQEFGLSDILNGEGGDPCFGGPKNLPMLLSELYGETQETLPREKNYLRAHLKCYDDLRRLSTDKLKTALGTFSLEGFLTPFFDDHRYQSLVSKLQAINIRLKGAHHILPKVDALSFPQGIVPHSPLFDRSVVEWSMNIPPQMKLHGSIEKYLLKQSVRDLLPSAILDRPKSGMLVPVEGWFQGPLHQAARDRLLSGALPFDLIRKDYVEQLLASGLGGLRPRHGAKIWLLITLESWLRSMEVR